MPKKKKPKPEDKPVRMSKRFVEYFAAHGRIGGSRRSPRKSAASRENIKKAQAARAANAAARRAAKAQEEGNAEGEKCA